MGLQAIYAKPERRVVRQEDKVYPYLLGGLEISRPNQVLCADITYIPMLQGFMYLVGIMDWLSRFVLAWQVSNTIDGRFCLEALQEALTLGRPKIFNSDEGVQFSAIEFSDCLEREGIRIRMDGRGRALENIFIERLWRSVKYEEVYLKEYTTVAQLYTGLDDYFRFYNHERLHQSLGYGTLAEVHFG